jgi:hypothetical protein
MTALDFPRQPDALVDTVQCDDHYVIDERELLRPTDHVDNRLQRLLGSTGIPASCFRRALGNDRRPG